MFHHSTFMIGADSILFLVRPEEKEDQKEDNGAKCDTQYLERYVVVVYDPYDKGRNYREKQQNDDDLNERKSMIGADLFHNCLPIAYPTVIPVSGTSAW